MEVTYIEIPKITDERWSLSFMESNRKIPFAINLVRYIYDLKNNGKRRWEHAHIETEQVLFCINGTVKIGLDNGKEKQVIELNQPNVWVLIPKMLWHRMEWFAENTILLAVTSHVFEEKDNIRDYDEFLQRVNA